MHNGNFFLFMTEGGGGIKYICLEDADTIGLSIFFCLQQKKYVGKKPKKKQKLIGIPTLGIEICRSRESQVS